MPNLLKWGDLPILVKDYGVSLSGSTLYGDWFNVNPINDFINSLGSTSSEQAQAIPSSGVKVLGNAVDISYGSTFATLPCYPNPEQFPPQTTQIELKCMGEHSSFGTRVWEFGYYPNLILGNTDNIYAGDVADTGRYYVFGVGLYSNPTPGVNDTLIGVASIFIYIDDNYTGWRLSPVSVTSCAIRLQYLYDMDYDIPISDDDNDYPDPSEPDGYGQTDGAPPAHDHSSDTIGIPDAPSVSSHDTGFMHVYKVSSGALSTLGQYLFPSFHIPTTPPTDVLDALNIIAEGLRAVAGTFAFRDSIQYIVDLHAIPISPTTTGSDYIKLGALTTEISQPTCSTDYVDFDCGTLSLPLNEQNYLDYLCRAKLFLPFVGFVDINPEYWNGGSINVTYRFNVIDGSFMAYVRSTSKVSHLSNSLIGQYGGSACLHLPVIANSYGAIASGLVSGSMAIAAGASSGNMLGAATSAATALNVQPHMSQSNNYNASTSFLGGRKPYLLIERPVPSFSTGYRHDKGLPLNVSMPLSSVHGFTVIEDIDLSGITGATENELAELKELLREGVYF